MPPRRSRAANKAEQQQAIPEAVPIGEPSVSSSTVPQSAEEAQPTDTSAATMQTSSSSSSSSSKGKGKSRAARHQPLLAEEQPSAVPSIDAEFDPSQDDAPPPPPSFSSDKPTMEDRQARLAALRAKMSASTRANRRDILSEQSRSRSIASELSNPSGSRKLQKAEKLLEERDLRESGTDVERHRNLHYSLEDSEAWDSKLEEKERRKDSGPGDFGDAAERAYQRQLRLLKPDLTGYKKQRDQAQALQAGSPASSLIRPSKAVDTRALDDELQYGTHKPSDDALDRVITHLNHEKQLIKNRSRRRNDEGEAEVNYINDSNRHFNKKLKRFYDKQTQEIRENLERGTAL